MVKTISWKRIEGKDGYDYEDRKGRFYIRAKKYCKGLGNWATEYVLEDRVTGDMFTEIERVREAKEWAEQVLVDEGAK